VSITILLEALLVKCEKNLRFIEDALLHYATALTLLCQTIYGLISNLLSFWLNLPSGLAAKGLVGASYFITNCMTTEQITQKIAILFVTYEASFEFSHKLHCSYC
jgi:hypothetical protein